jgi:hypothetical protein
VTGGVILDAAVVTGGSGAPIDVSKEPPKVKLIGVESGTGVAAGVDVIGAVVTGFGIGAAVASPALFTLSTVRSTARRLRCAACRKYNGIPLYGSSGVIEFAEYCQLRNPSQN